jgi:hypothetical protein
MVQTPGVSVQKSVDKTSLDDPGGTVTYIVAVTNDKSNFGSVTLNQICDNVYGTIATVAGQPACPTGSLDGTATVTSSSCNLPATIALGDTFNCTFTAKMTEQNSPVTDIATANGVGADGKTGFSTQSNSVTVTVNEAASTATITKRMEGTLAGCATVRYGVDIKNTSAADETLTLQKSAGGTPPIIALNDSQFGDVTKVQGNVLGTTCGIASGNYGLGTMASGQSGQLQSTADVLPATILVGGHYICQFDAQFCGGIGSIDTGTGTCSGIQNTDTITPALIGDEGEAVSKTGGSLTVSECFMPSAQ